MWNWLKRRKIKREKEKAELHALIALAYWMRSQPEQDLKINIKDTSYFIYLGK
jgi:hypothetical protein